MRRLTGSPAARRSCSTRAAERIAWVTLAACEAFGNYPPGRVIQMATRIPGGIYATMQLPRFRAARRAPGGWGQDEQAPSAPARSWTAGSVAKVGGDATLTARRACCQSERRSQLEGFQAEGGPTPYPHIAA